MSTRPTAEHTHAVRGQVSRVRFRADSGFTVLLASVQNLENPGERDDDAVLVGMLPPVEAGEVFTAQVSLEEHREYGHQYRAHAFAVEDAPAELTEDGVAAYLQGRVSGVGRVLAGRIARAFGTDAFRVIEEEPRRLLTVPGVSESTLHKMLQSWDEKGSERRRFAELQSLGLSVSQTQRALAHFGEVAAERLRADLYVLTEVEGVGFVTADRLALGLGVARDDPRRLTAAAVYAVEQAALSAGHTHLPWERALRGLSHYTRVTGPSAEEALERACEAGRLREEGGRVYLPHALATERRLAKAIRTLLATPPAAPFPAAPAALGLSEEQAGVFALLQAGRLAVLTGGPGTGKSTTTRAVADAAEEAGLSVALCAPTGKAARRLSEVTGREARTVHRLLGYGPGGFAGEPLDADLVILDEASMAGDALLGTLLASLPPGSRALIVGDADQLPPVEAGLPLSALTEVAPTLRLKEVFRQAARSPIIRAAHGLLRGEPPAWGAELPFTDLETDTGARRAALLLRELGGPGGVQLLSPMRRGGLGVEALNAAAQTLFNPGEDGVWIGGGGEARPGDPVVQTKNDYGNDVFNGTLGRVVQARGNALTVEFEGDNLVELSGAELAHLQLAYALTVHRAQGSEWGAVLTVLDTSHAPMLARELAYTALTRAKVHFYGAGAEAAWQTAATRRREERCSSLLERVRGEL